MGADNSGLVPPNKRKGSRVSDHIGVSGGAGLSVDIFLKQGPIEGEDWLAVSVHVPLTMIAALELPPQEQENPVSPAPVSATGRIDSE